MNHRTVLAATLVSLFSSLVSAQVAVSPASLTFATEALSTTSAKQQVNVTNNSSTAVSFTSITASGNFSVASRTCSLETALAAGASCVVKVGFTPTTVGTNSGTLTLIDSDPSSPQTVALKGVGTEVSLSPDSVNFGTQLLNATPAPTSVALKNIGTTALTVTAIAITGDFQIASQNCIASGSTSGTVSTGATCTLNLSFVPTAVGKRTGTLTISDNGGGSTQTVALSGTASSLALSTSSLAFGSQYVKLPSAVKAFTISNVSPTTAFSVTGISLSVADYSEVSSCIPAGKSSGTVLPNGQCAIYVTFAPTAAGSRPGTMTMSTNGGGAGTLSLALSGTGLSGVGVSLSPSVAAITDTAVLPLTATLTNTSNKNVTWTVDGVANGNSSLGTIASTGANTATYTPPSADGSHTITATSVASTSRSASMTVTVTDYAGVFTYHNDNARDGQNQQETVLTPANVNVAQFGQLFSYQVDGQVYAQPLYVANVSIPGQGFHNVLYVATENDSVYAFDADGLNGNTPLWQVSFLSANVTTVPSTAINANYTDLFPQIGITGTPVIDPTAGTLFVVAKTNETGVPTQQLHALNIATGAEQAGGPITIGGPSKTSPTAISIKTDNDTKYFSPLLENQRPALLLLNGVVYIAWGSHGDIGVYHGWVIGFNETTLALESKYITTPIDSYGGIWQSGGGPAADSSGNIYVASGNGPEDATTTRKADPPIDDDLSGSFIKLTPTTSVATGLAVAGYFKPSTNTTDNSYEMSSGGPVILPLQTGSTPDVAIIAGKDKNFYLVNRDTMAVLPSISPAFKGGVFSTPSVWQSNIYVWAETDILRSFQLQSGQLVPTATYPLNMGYPGAGTATSSNGTQNAILWALDSRAVLHAFDATNVAHEFYNSSEASGDSVPGDPVKFAVPTIANGKVYVGSANQITGFGLLP